MFPDAPWRVTDVHLVKGCWDLAELQNKSLTITSNVNFSLHDGEEKKLVAVSKFSLEFIEPDKKEKVGKIEVEVHVFYDTSFDLPEVMDEIMAEIGKDANLISAGMARAEVIRLMRSAGINIPFIFPSRSFESRMLEGNDKAFRDAVSNNVENASPKIVNEEKKIRQPRANKKQSAP